MHCIRLGQVVLDQPQSDVVSHPLQLLVHFDVVIFVVFAELSDYGSVGEGNEFGVHLVDTGSLNGSVRILDIMNVNIWVGASREGKVLPDTGGGLAMDQAAELQGDLLFSSAGNTGCCHLFSLLRSIDKSGYIKDIDSSRTFTSNLDVDVVVVKLAAINSRLKSLFLTDALELI